MYDEGISHTSLLVDIAAEAGHHPEVGRLVLLRRSAHRPGPRERQAVPEGQPAAHGRGRGEGEGAARHACRRRRGRGRGRRRVSLPASPALEPDPRRPGTLRVEINGVRFGAVPDGGGAGRRAGARAGAVDDRAARAARRGGRRRGARSAPRLRALERRSFARARSRPPADRARVIHGPRSSRRSSAPRRSACSTTRRSPSTTCRRARRAGAGPRVWCAISWPWESSEVSSTARSPLEWPEGADRAAVPQALASKRAAQLGNLPKPVKRRRLLAYLARRGFAGRDISDMVARLVG